MIVINFYGGPGSGKSTLAAELFIEMRKLRGPNVELVHEFATELCFEDARDNLKDQLYLAGNQWHRLWRLERRGVEIAISDSPIYMGTAYADLQDCPYADELKAVKDVLVQQHFNYNILVHRDVYATGGFKGISKKRNTVYANSVDAKIRKLPVDFHEEVVFVPGLGLKVFQSFMQTRYGLDIQRTLDHAKARNQTYKKSAEDLKRDRTVN
jgi:hypothetical protein